jgi:hypothetical protein
LACQGSAKTYLFRLCQLAPDTVEVYDALRGVVVGQYFGVELAESVGFTLSELVSRCQNPNFVDEFVVCFSISLSVCQVDRQPRCTPSNISTEKK